MSTQKSHKRLKTEDDRGADDDAVGAQELRRPNDDVAAASTKHNNNSTPLDVIASFERSFDCATAKAYIQNELDNEEEIDRHLKLVQSAQSRLNSLEQKLRDKKELVRLQRLDAAEACYVCEETKEGLEDPVNNEMLECGCLLDEEESKRSFGLRVCNYCFDDSDLQCDVLNRNEACRCSLCRAALSCGNICHTKLLPVAAAERPYDYDEDFDVSRFDYCEKCYNMDSYDHDPSEDSYVCVDCTTKMGLCEDDFLFQCVACKKPLVPKETFSEMKRGTLISNSLMGMPSAVLDKILGLVGAFSMDLVKISTVSSRFRSSTERVARGVVEETRHMFPSGPVYIDERDEESWDGWPGYQSHPERVYAMGTNDEPLAAPKDATTWKGVLFLLEKLTQYSCAFSFRSEEASLEMASEFLRDRDKMKFTKFCSKYSSEELENVVHQSQLAGSLKLKGNEKDVLAVVSDSPVNGNGAQVQRVIGHFRFSRAIDDTFWVGLVGRESSSLVDSAACSYGETPRKFGFHFDHDQWTDDGKRVIVRGDATFGIEYNPAKQLLTMYSTDHWTGWNWNGKLIETRKVDPKKKGCDRLYWAASIASEVISQPGTLLSMRTCNETDEWKEFLAYHKKEVKKMWRAGARLEERRDAFYEEYPTLDFDEFGHEFGYNY